MLQTLYYAIPPIMRNKYALTVLLFVLWILFFDSNTPYSQWQMRQEIRAMQAQKANYEQEITEVKKTLDGLTNSNSNIERFAREKYLMKRPNEDIFIISKEK